MQWTTALDEPAHCTNAPGWLLVRHLDRAHPVCADVSTLHLLSCASIGALDADVHGCAPRVRFVAFTSERGWADRAGFEPPAFYGDGVRSPQDEQGSIPVIACVEFGRGRCVVLGDQNMVGDAMLHFRHNRRLALNCFEWLGQPTRADPTAPFVSRILSGADSALVPLRLTPPPHNTRIGVDMRYRPLAAVKEGPLGLVGFYMNLNRCAEISAEIVSLGERVLPRLALHSASPNGVESGSVDNVCGGIEADDDRTHELDALLIPAPTAHVDAASVRALRAMAAAGRTIVLLLDERALCGSGGGNGDAALFDSEAVHALDLLEALAPDFTFDFPTSATTARNGSLLDSPSAVLASKLASTSLSASPSLSSSSATATVSIADRARLRDCFARLSHVPAAAGALRLRSDCAPSAATMRVEHLHLQDWHHGVDLPRTRSQWGRSLLRTDPTAYNAALGCAAYQSSECEDAQRAAPAAHATDGDFLTHSHTSLVDRHAWLLIDLGRAVPLQSVAIFNRAEISQIRFSDLVVQLYADVDNAATDADGNAGAAQCSAAAAAVEAGTGATDAGHWCSALGCTTVARNVCAACRVARYCGAACQRAHWVHHKRQCGGRYSTVASSTAAGTAAGDSNAAACVATGALVYATAVLNPNNSLESPTHITIHPRRRESGSGGSERMVRARFIRVSRLASTQRHLHPEDQCILSIAQVVAVAPIDEHAEVAAVPSNSATVADATRAASPAGSRSRGQAALVPYNAAPFARRVSQSSTEHHAAANAVDGRLDSFTHTATEDARACWRIDLGRALDVRLVTLVNRADGWTNRLRDIVVEMHTDANADAGAAQDESDRQNTISDAEVSKLRLVYASAAPLNANNRLGGPAQLTAITHSAASSRRARYVTVRRVAVPGPSPSRRGGGGDNMHAGDRNVLSLAQVRVIVRPDANDEDGNAASMAVSSASSEFDRVRETQSVDIARIGHVWQPPANDSSVSASASSASSSSSATMAAGQVSGSDAHTEGNLIVFLQHGFWTNRCVGQLCDRRSATHGEMATRLQYALVDYLHARHPFKAAI